MTSLTLGANFAGYAGARPLAILAAPFSNANGAATRVQTKRARRGEIDQFLASVEHKAFVLARAALGEREAALDVVQDSMLKLVERYAHKPAAEWPALFFTIVNHRITDIHRYRRLREGINKVVSLFGGEREDGSYDLGEAATIAAPERSPEENLVAQRERAAIDAAMMQLPDRQRQVFVLREWQELSVKETAQVLGCTEGTVKQHHFRALKSLRRLLAPAAG